MDIKERSVRLLRKSVRWYNFCVKHNIADLRSADLGDADLSYADLRNANLSSADLRSADLRSADLDFSCLPLWCGSLAAKFDQKQIIQFLYHAAKPCQNNEIADDEDLVKLLKSDLFQKVVNKFHRVSECGKFEF